MICPLYQKTKEAPDDIFLESSTGTYSYSDVNAAAYFFQNWLEDQDILEDDIIAVSELHPFVLTALLFACTRAGIILAILSDRDPNFSHESIAIRYDFQILTQKQRKELEDIVKEELWKNIIQTQEAPPIILENIPFTILFTSGSTSYHKAVVHSFMNHWASAQNSFTNIPFQKGDRWLLSLSLWHIGGLAMIFRAILGGGTLITRSPSEDLFTAIKNKKITHLSVVSTQLVRILPHSPFPSLKAVLVGGGPIPPYLIRTAVQNQLPIHTTYGMTELSSQCTTTNAGADLLDLLSAGAPLGDWEIKISEQEEILVKGKALFLGYWNGYFIEEPQDSEGYFHTKDTGVIENGKLYPIGRIDQMFISGGENIHPEEIEKQLRKFVTQAIVVPIPNEEYGHRPIAFLYGEYELEEIIEHLSFHLPKFKHPDHFLPWPSQVSIIKPSRKLLHSLAASLFQMHSPKNTQPSITQQLRPSSMEN